MGGGGRLAGALPYMAGWGSGAPPAVCWHARKRVSTRERLAALLGCPPLQLFDARLCPPPMQVRFEVADALLNSNIALGAACGNMQPRQEQSTADQAASVLLQRRCLQLLHRACVAVPQLGPVGIACQAAEASLGLFFASACMLVRQPCRHSAARAASTTVERLPAKRRPRHPACCHPFPFAGNAESSGGRRRRARIAVPGQPDVCSSSAALGG